jgi:hypothetical protein
MSTNKDKSMYQVIDDLASQAIMDAACETYKLISKELGLDEETSKRMLIIAMTTGTKHWFGFDKELCLHLDNEYDESKQYLEQAMKAMKKHNIG